MDHIRMSIYIFLAAHIFWHKWMWLVDYDFTVDDLYLYMSPISFLWIDQQLVDMFLITLKGALLKHNCVERTKRCFLRWVPLQWSLFASSYSDENQCRLLLPSVPSFSVSSSDKRLLKVSRRDLSCGRMLVSAHRENILFSSEKQRMKQECKVADFVTLQGAGLKIN